MWVKVGSGPDEGKKVLVDGEVFTVGSGADAHLRLADDEVALAHAFFKTLSDGRVELHDLGSEAGTFVNGERLEGSVLLLGDEDVRVGGSVLVLSLGDPDAASGDLDEEVAELDRALAAAGGEQTARRYAEAEPAGTRRIYSGRAAVAYLRQMRRTVRRALVLAAAAVAAALIVLILALTGVIGGDEDEGIDTAQIVKAATDATVLVRSNAGGQQGAGSGWVLDADEGLVVTNFHVVNGASRIESGPPDGLQDAEVVGAAPCEDLAVLELEDAEGLKTLPLGSQEDVEQGDHVVAVGYPLNASLEDQLTATDGVVSVVESRLPAPAGDAPSFDNVIQTDAALSPGNSGGPLVSEDREIIGMNTAILTELAGQPVQGQSYAIGIDQMKDVLGGLREGDSRGWLGGAVAAAPPRARGRRELPPGVVVGVRDLGLPEALLVAVNGDRVDSVASYCSTAGEIGSGQQATLSLIDRPGGRPKDVTAEFE
jgi:S1-C subfamily serine protease